MWCSWAVHAYGLPVRSPAVDSILAANPHHLASAMYHADHGDYDKLEAFLTAWRDSVAGARARGEPQIEAYEAKSIQAEAYLRWKRDGEPARAAESMLSVDRFMRIYSLPTAEMLLESDQPREAARLLEYIFDRGSLTAVLYRLAPLYERLGEPDKARDAYAEFVERWRDADPQLQPMVDTARAALERLGPMDQ